MADGEAVRCLQNADHHGLHPFGRARWCAGIRGRHLDRSFHHRSAMSVRRGGSGLGYYFSGFLDLFLPVTVDAMTTRIAATTMATIQRTQSMPALPLPPNAV